MAFTLPAARWKRGWGMLLLAWTVGLGAAGAAVEPGAASPKPAAVSAVIGIYQQPSGRWSKRVETGLARRLRAAGFTVEMLNARQLADAAFLRPQRLACLVVDDIAAVPATAEGSISRYAHAGGFLVALGGPAFSRPLFHYGRAWLNRVALENQMRIKVRPLALPNTPAGWTSAYPPKHPTPATVQVISGPPQARRGYRFAFAKFHGRWDFLLTTAKAPAGATATVLWAKSGKRFSTPQLGVMWTQRDGKRWVAVIHLSAHWRRYILPQKAFSHFWPSPAKTGHLELAKANTLGFFLDRYHTALIADGTRAVEVAGVGTARLSAGRKRLIRTSSVPLIDAPVIDTVSPVYMVYPVTDMATLNVDPSQAIAPCTPLPTPASTDAVDPRPEGTGFDKHRAVRYVPLLDCRNKAGRFVGAAAALMLPATRPGHRGITLSMPVTDGRFFSDPAVQSWLARTIHRLVVGVYLAEGGAKYYASFGGEVMPIGAVVNNLGGRPQPVRIAAVVRDAAGRTVWSSAARASIAPRGHWRWQGQWRVPGAEMVGWTGRPQFSVAVTLRRAGKVVDRLAQQLWVWVPPKHPQFVTARNGQFYLGNKRWYFYGVNYAPSSGIGQARGSPMSYYMGGQLYDPAVVQRDLEDIRAVGFNSVSVWLYYRDYRARNLLDLLCRCRALGLKVNLALCTSSSTDVPLARPLYPGFSFVRWARQVGRMITAMRLAHNSTVVSYDTSWEPHWGWHAQRMVHDAAWRTWIRKRYGSIRKAEATWGCQAPRAGSKVTNPLDAQMVDYHGPARKMVLAYCDFLNALLARSFGRVSKIIRAVDPNHLVSFRMAGAGDPALWGGHDWGFPYDYAGLKNVVGFFGPEAYPYLLGGRRGRLYGLFNLGYARAIGPDLPVVYTEFGDNVTDPGTLRPSLVAERREAREYRLFFRTLLRGGANGAICWYFPGGCREPSQSDFGIINQDRSWRPVTYVIHDFAARFTAPRPIPRPTVWIPIQLGRYVGYAHGIWMHIRKRFTNLAQSGQLPGLRVVRWQSKTSP